MVFYKKENREYNMFLKKYLNEFKFNILINNYEEEYLNKLD